MRKIEHYLFQSAMSCWIIDIPGHSCWRLSRLAKVLLTAYTCNPRLCRRIQRARPMPAPAPVTTTLFPCRSDSIILSQRLVKLDFERRRHLTAALLHKFVPQCAARQIQIIRAATVYQRSFDYPLMLHQQSKDPRAQTKSRKNAISRKMNLGLKILSWSWPTQTMKVLQFSYILAKKNRQINGMYETDSWRFYFP